MPNARPSVTALTTAREQTGKSKTYSPYRIVSSAHGISMRDGWSSLASIVEKSEIVEHHGYLNMPIQLRVFLKQIHGRGLGGHHGTEICNS